MKSFWWCLKVTVGASLIVCLVAYYLGEAQANHVPRWVAQAVIFLVGGYALFRQSLVEDQQLLKQHGEVFNDWRQRTWLL